jgi:fibronectin-binding autotransporter adhesin
MAPTTRSSDFPVAAQPRVCEGSPIQRRRWWVLALVSLAAMAAGAWSQPVVAVTYTWSNATNGGLWSTSGNWVGSPTLTFNNQTDLIFNAANVLEANRSNAVSIGAGAKTIRSLTINADYLTTDDVTFDVRTNNGFGASTTAVNLTFSANSGNASITVAESTAGIKQVRLGTNNFGNVVLNSNLDLAQNNTFLNVTGLQFNSAITGTGTINKTGAGVVGLVRTNSGWSGGLNINDGTVLAYASGNAMGTGAWTLGGGANNTTLRVGSNVTHSNSGGLTVVAGAGTRTITNIDTAIGSGVGNPTLGGAITLNKDVIFDVTAYAATTHERITASGVISGTGGIVKNGTGGLQLTGTNNTFAGATTVNGGGSGYVTILADSGLGAAPGSATASHLVLNNGGLVSGSSFTLSANRGIELAGDGGLIFTNTATSLVYDGIMAGTNLIKDGTGVLNLGGANTYAGTTTVSAGGLLVNGANSGVGLATVASGARIGGTGSLAGGLTIASGGLFVFNPADPTLDVSGAVSLANSFSVSSLVNSDGSAINWGSVADGTYQLIGTTASSFANILNFGAGNAATIAAGRTAYFTDGSLNLVIVPEPGGLALAGLGIAAAAWARRRRT